MSVDSKQPKQNAVISTVCTRCESMVSERRGFIDPKEFAEKSVTEPGSYYANVAADTKAYLPYRYSLEVNGCMKC